MSRSQMFIRFKKTGNIYYGCNLNTSNYMLPVILDTRISKVYPNFNYFTDLYEKFEPIDDLPDLDDVEIYVVDYNCCYKSVGSESHCLIINGTEKCFDEEPDWVKTFK